MGEMRFEDDANEFGRPPARETGSSMTNALMRWGLVSTEKEGQYVLLAVGAIAVMAAIYFFMTSGGGAPPPPPIE